MFIQPITWFDQTFLWRLENTLGNMFDGALFRISSDIILPPLTAFNWYRQQYYSPSIIKYIYNKIQDIITKEYNYVICLGDIDAYSDNLNFVFGEAAPYLKVACVYTRRLKTFTSSSFTIDISQLYLERTIKEIVHEWGHLLGLTHCADKNCVMSFSNSIIEVDAKTPFFCNRCAKKLFDKYNIIQRRRQ